MTDGVSGVDSTVPAEDVSQTGTNAIDGILYGRRWVSDTGSDVTTLSFSFPDENSLFSTDVNGGYGTSGEEPHTGLAGLSESAQGLFLAALENLSSFSKLAFMQVADSGNSAGTIRVAFTGITGDDSVAWAYLPGNYQAAGDIWILSENHSESDVDFGQTLTHELGHALGLKHPFEEEGSSVVLDSSLDGVDYTVMSYNISVRFPTATYADLWPQTYMYADILALQYLYGVDTVTTGSADAYVYDQAERHYLAIWDYGGDDTLGVTGGTRAVKLDLTPGSWSDVGTTIQYSDNTNFFTDSNTVYITPDTIIENAYGAGGDDTLQGNDVANKLTGNDGNDTLMGGAGADRLKGGSGNDYLQGGVGSDVLTSGVGSDVAVGGDGNDTLWAGGGDEGNDVSAGGSGDDIVAGGSGDDLLIGGGLDDGETLDLVQANESATGDGSDTLFGGAGADTLLGGGWDDSVVDNGSYDDGEAVTSGTGSDKIWSGAGDDLVVAAAGDDVLGGGAGDDTINGGAGNDLFYGGKDAGDTGTNDVLNGGAGNDIIFGSAGNDSLDGGSGADDLFGGAGDDTVVGGSGNDTLWGGGGDDRFTGGAGDDIFVFAAGSGDDRVTDFDLPNDTLRLSNTTTDFTDINSVIAASTAVSGGVLIDLGGGDSLRLDGISLNDLSEITFVF